MSELRPALVGGKGQRRPVLALEQLLTPWRTGGGRSRSLVCVSTPMVAARAVLGRFENSHFWGT